MQLKQTQSLSRWGIEARDMPWRTPTLEGIRCTKLPKMRPDTIPQTQTRDFRPKHIPIRIADSNEMRTTSCTSDGLQVKTAQINKHVVSSHMRRELHERLGRRREQHPRRAPSGKSSTRSAFDKEAGARSTGDQATPETRRPQVPG